LGKSPVLTIDGTVYAESGFIVQHLIKRFGKGKFAPTPDSPAFERYEFWLHFAEGSAMPPITMKYVFDVIHEKAPFIIRPIVNKIISEVNKTFLGPNLKNNFEYIEAELGKNDGWLVAGNISGADIMMSYPIMAAFNRKVADKDTHPNMAKFMTAIEARPAYQKAVQIGGPVDL